jgi:hypothetical protein
MTVVEALIPENPENISALVKKLPPGALIHVFWSKRPKFLPVKAVQERLFTHTDLTG